MRLYPSAATRITRPLLTSDEAVAANVGRVDELFAYLASGEMAGLLVPDGCPTVTFHPLTPRQRSYATLRAGLNCPRGEAAMDRIQSIRTAHAEWVDDGRVGPEPVVDPEDAANVEAWGAELAYASVDQAVVSFGGVPGLDPLPPDWLDILPRETVLEIARMVREVSEVTPAGKASSGSPPSARTPSASASGTAPPASETASAPPEVIAADHSPPPCSTSSETPACLGATSTTAPTETRPGGWW